jgi:hypothetical protein
MKPTVSPSTNLRREVRQKPQIPASLSLARYRGTIATLFTRFGRKESLECMCGDHSKFENEKQGRGILDRSLVFTEADQHDLWSHAFLEIRNGRRRTIHMGRAVRKFDFENSARGRITNMPIVVMSFREEGFLEATHVTSIMEFQITRRRAKP